MLCKEISWPQQNAVWSNNNWKIFFTLFSNQTIQNGWSKLYAKFVSGTLKENCCQKTFTYFNSLKVIILFQSILFDYFHQMNKLFQDLSKIIRTCPSISMYVQNDFERVQTVRETGPNCIVFSNHSSRIQLLIFFHSKVNCFVQNNSNMSKIIMYL